MRITTSQSFSRLMLPIRSRFPGSHLSDNRAKAALASLPMSTERKYRVMLQPDPEGDFSIFEVGL